MPVALYDLGELPAARLPQVDRAVCRSHTSFRSISSLGYGLKYTC